MMKKRLAVVLLSALLAGGTALCPVAAHANMEWTVLKTIELEQKVLDVAPSLDGQWLYILTRGEVLLYSPREEKVVERISVGKNFDRIASLPGRNGLTISSTKKKTVQIVMIEPVYKIDVSGLPFKGPADAFVTVAVFSDYQCPYCAGLESVLRQVLEKYPKDVKIVMVNFPLSMHSYARKAAIAAAAASKQGKFWEMHEKLFVSQKELSDAKVQAIAKEMGLDMEKFGSDLKNPEVAALVDRDIERGLQANVQGTPSIFINGKQMLGQPVLPAFQAAIDRELKKTK